MNRAAQKRQTARSLSMQEKAWKVIRGMGEFTVSEVVALTGENEGALRGYVGQLRRCGYVRTVGTRKGEGRKGEKAFRLAKNTGPRPPRWTGALWDPNTKSLVGGCREHVD